MVHYFQQSLPSPIQSLSTQHDVRIHIKRDDLIDPQVSGNKLYKLVHNMEEAQRQHAKSILTFGGAFSNHIAATARYGKMVGIKTIGVIRGEPTAPLNPTLTQAEEDGMQLYFISRSRYRQKQDPEFLEALSEQFDQPFIIPEGGANYHGIKGASTMLDERTRAFSHIYVGVGTGTTLAGLCMAAGSGQCIRGVVVHKHGDIWNDVQALFPSETDVPEQPELIQDMHFGGFGKWNDALIECIRHVKSTYGIELDPIYTGKVYMAILRDIDEGRLPRGATVLMMHTGGVQGNKGFEQRFGVSLSA